MAIWTRRQQEQEGTYTFSGAFYITQGVRAKLSTIEIILIYCEVQKLVREKGGIDYFQSFVSDRGDKLYFIDQCSPETMASGLFRAEDNYCTLLFSHEY